MRARIREIDAGSNSRDRCWVGIREIDAGSNLRDRCGLKFARSMGLEFARAMLARTGDGNSGSNLGDCWLEQVTAMGPRIWESDDGLKEQGWLEGWHEMMCGVGGAQWHNPVWGLRIPRVKTKNYIILCTVPSLLCRPFFI